MGKFPSRRNPDLTAKLEEIAAAEEKDTDGA